MTDRKQTDTQWADQAAQQLRAAERDIDPDIAAKLQAARARALKAAQARHPHRGWVPGLLGAGAAAAAVVFTVLLYSPAETTSDLLPFLEEAEMAAAQDAELLENLEFVAWMLEYDEELPVDDLPIQG